MKKILMFLFLLPFCLNATEVEKLYTIKGVVTDTEGIALSSASVSVVGTNVGIATNSKGEFAFKIKEGTYTVRASFTGYILQEQTINANEEPSLTFVLEEAKNGLNEVVVTGTRTERMLKDVPVLTRVITSQDIKQINPPDFKTLLEYEIPGLQFESAGHGTALPALSFQGVGAQYVLFLIDGERIAGEGATNNIDYNMLDVDNIERVEIIKGAASALYGSNALGGVINIITKNPDRPFVGNVSTRISTLDEQKHSLSLGAKLDKFSSLTTVSYSKKDAYRIADRNGSETIYERPGQTDSVVVAQKDTSGVRGYETIHLQQKLGYNFNEKLSVDLKGSYYRNDLLEPSQTDEETRFSNYTIGGNVHYIFNALSQLTLSYNHSKFDKHETTVATDHEIHTYGDMKNTARLNYTNVIAEKHALTAGLEFDGEKLNHYMFKDTTAKDMQTYTLYVQDEFGITNHFSLVGGFRADHHSAYDLHISPKITAMYRINGFSFRGGYAAGFRSPSLKELYTEWSHRGMFMMIGNPDLKPETSHHVSVSAEYTKGIFNASVSGYYNWFNDKIVTYMTDERMEGGKINNMSYENSDSARTYGIDVNAQLKLPFDLTLKGSYSYVNDKTEINGRNSSYVRPHSATVRAEYKKRIGNVRTTYGLSGRWMGSVEAWSYSSSTGLYSKKVYDARSIWRLNAMAQFPRGINLNVAVENLFNFKDKNVSGDNYASLTRGTEFIATLSINIADLIGK